MNAGLFTHVATARWF